MKPLLVPLLLLNLLPAVAVAQPEKPEPGRRDGRGDKGPRGHGRGPWKEADLDKDGKISPEEFSKMPRIEGLPIEKRDQLFGRLDKNGDGSLEGEELVRHHGGPGRGPHRLKELDLDRSGGVSFAEFEQGEFFKKLPAEKRREIFDRMDTNSDGELNPLDRPHSPQRRKGERPMSPRELIRHHDADGDGKLSFEEFRKGPMVRHLDEDGQEDRFEAADRNKDGFWSPEDFDPPENKGGE